MSYHAVYEIQIMQSAMNALLTWRIYCNNELNYESGIQSRALEIIRYISTKMRLIILPI